MSDLIPLSEQVRDHIDPELVGNMTLGQMTVWANRAIELLDQAHARLAELETIKAQAEDATEYVLAGLLQREREENRDLKARLIDLEAQLQELGDPHA